jgi:hypothetical protein
MVGNLNSRLIAVLSKLTKGQSQLLSVVCKRHRDAKRGCGDTERDCSSAGNKTASTGALLERTQSHASRTRGAGRGNNASTNVRCKTSKHLDDNR